MGLFDKFKLGLGKSSSSLSEGFKDIFSKKIIDDRVLNEFEELIISSDAGVDVFHASTRRFDDPEFEGSPLNLAGWTKKISGLPTITVGSVGLDDEFLRSTFGGEAVQRAGIDALLKRLENDEFDLVAVGRALLSDPAWADKVRAGHENDIVVFSQEHIAELT